MQSLTPGFASLTRGYYCSTPSVLYPVAGAPGFCKGLGICYPVACAPGCYGGAGISYPVACAPGCYGGLGVGGELQGFGAGFGFCNFAGNNHICLTFKGICV